MTNHEAQFFPAIKSKGGREFPFDSILVDVPCSGDGTMRKAPDIWPRWTVGNGTPCQTMGGTRHRTPRN